MPMEQNRGKWGHRGHSSPTYNRKKILNGWDHSDWQGQGISQLFFLIASDCRDARCCFNGRTPMSLSHGQLQLWAQAAAQLSLSLGKACGWLFSVTGKTSTSMPLRGCGSPHAGW